MANYTSDNSYISFKVSGSNVLNLSSSANIIISGSLITPDFSGSGDPFSKITYTNSTGSVKHPNGIPYTFDLINFRLQNAAMATKPAVITNGFYQGFYGTYFSRDAYIIGIANTGYILSPDLDFFGKNAPVIMYSVNKNFNNPYDTFRVNLYSLNYAGSFSSFISPSWGSGYCGTDGSNISGYGWFNVYRRAAFHGPSTNFGFSGVGTSQNTKTVNVSVSGNVFVTGSLSVGMNSVAYTSSIMPNAMQVSGNIIPRASSNTDMNLGSSTKLWNDIYAAGTIKTSDADLKYNIKNCQLGLGFINDLNPIKYRYKGGIRVHYGLIAQEVKEILYKHNIDTVDFAGYVEGQEGNKFLRYEEFLSPLIKAIQELSARINALEKEIEARGL